MKTVLRVPSLMKYNLDMVLPSISPCKEGEHGQTKEQNKAVQQYHKTTKILYNAVQDRTNIDGDNDRKENNHQEITIDADGKHNKRKNQEDDDRNAININEINFNEDGDRNERN